MHIKLVGAFALASALTACVPSEPIGPVRSPGEAAAACRSGIQEACAVLAMQQDAMRGLVRSATTPPTYRPIQVYGPQPGREARSTCQTLNGITRCTTQYQ